jgi:hypothetical protein
LEVIYACFDEFHFRFGHIFGNAIPSENMYLAIFDIYGGPNNHRFLLRIFEPMFGSDHSEEFVVIGDLIGFDLCIAEKKALILDL